MKIKAYAKINISLDIVGKRESDGYHLLKMIMQNIDLYDEISIEKQKEGITISCNKNYVPTDSRNLAYKAASLFKETYNIEVIISAHPRSDYEKHSDAYKGFRVIKNSTCLLVRDAKFVMTAASTSFLYAVTYKKPLLFIYQNALEEGLPSHIRFMIALSKEFDKSIINIDEFDYGNTSLIDEQLKINDVLYQKSAENYVKQNFDGTIRGESYKKEIIAFLEAL